MRIPPPFLIFLDKRLAFWDRGARVDTHTGLRTWHDQLESGADNCVLSQCPNHRSACWTDAQAFTLASADVITLLQREHTAYALFLDEWAQSSSALPSASSSPSSFTIPAVPGAAATATATDTVAAEYQAAAVHHRARADVLAKTLNEKLWRADLGYHVAWNVSSQSPIEASGTPHSQKKKK